MNTERPSVRSVACALTLLLAATACGSSQETIESTEATSVATSTTTSPIDPTTTAVGSSTTTSTTRPGIPALDCSLAPIADFAPLSEWSRDEVLVLAELDFDGDGTTEALVNTGAGILYEAAVIVRRNGCQLETVPTIDIEGRDVENLAFLLTGNSNLGSSADIVCLPALDGGVELVAVWTSATADIFGADDPLIALRAWETGGADLNVTVDRWIYDGDTLRQTSTSGTGFAFVATHRWPYINGVTCSPRPASTTVLPIDAAGVGPVAFGASAAEAIAALEPLIGPPLSDTGYNNLPVVYCSEGSVQVVSWGGLHLTFTDTSFGSYGPGLVNVHADHTMWPATEGETRAGFECAE